MTIYTVQKNDTLHSVARKFSVPASRILTDNFLKTDRLTAGQNLVILSPTVTHTVRGGETFDHICQKYHITPNELFRNNPSLNGQRQVFPSACLNISYEDTVYGEKETSAVAYSHIAEDILCRTLPYLTYVQIYSSGVCEDGSIMDDTDNSRILELAHMYKVCPILTISASPVCGKFSKMITNEVLINSEKKENLIDSLKKISENNSYGGFCFDFPYIDAEVSKNFFCFFETLATALPKGTKLWLNMDILAATNDLGGSVLSEYSEICNRICFSTYPFGKEFGSPEANVSTSKLKTALEKISDSVNKNKCLVGIPNYAYDRIVPYSPCSGPAEIITNEEALRRCTLKCAQIIFDENEKAPYYKYFDRPGTYRDAVEHVVNFDNAESCSALLKCIAEEGFGGLSVWDMMHYFPELWMCVNSYFKIKKI